jgi:L-threonylcarbamoyladenylate synthase
LVTQTGPLAVASAARKGMAAPKSLGDVWVLESDVALKFDNGNLRKGPISTVIEADETGVRYLREGAISLAEIQAIVPGATGI